MRAIENGGKTKQNKKKIICSGKERRGSIIRLGLVKKNKEVSSFIIVDGVVRTWLGLP